MVKIAVLANLVTYIFMHLRYNLWQMISLHSLGGCVRIKRWVCTNQKVGVYLSISYVSYESPSRLSFATIYLSGTPLPDYW